MQASHGGLFGKIAVHLRLINLTQLNKAVEICGRQGGRIQSGRKQGMQSMDEGLMSLVQTRTISLEEAFRRASHKAPFQKLLEETQGGTQ